MLGKFRIDPFLAICLINFTSATCVLSLFKIRIPEVTAVTSSPGSFCLGSSFGLYGTKGINSFFSSKSVHGDPWISCVGAAKVYSSAQICSKVMGLGVSYGERAGCCWTPPKAHKFEINVDAAIDFRMNKSATGWLLGIVLVWLFLLKLKGLGFTVLYLQNFRLFRLVLIGLGKIIIEMLLSKQIHLLHVKLLTIQQASMGVNVLLFGH